jgi:rhomboid protease GluP
MSRILVQAWKTAPVTCSCVAVAVLLHVVVTLTALTWFRSVDDARWKLGAVVQLELVHEPDVSGLLDLWNGQLWRIPVTAFHHGGAFHLLMNSLALGFFGYLAEPRVGRLRFGCFLLSSAVVSMLPECLLGNAAVGLSGVAYAVFGLLLVLRRRDHDVALWMSDSIVAFGLLWLVFCVAATNFEILRIANAAHFSGLIYGWIAGQVWFASEDWNGRLLRNAQPAVFKRIRPAWIGRLWPVRWRKPNRLALAAFYAAHLLLLPGLQYAREPSRDGRFHWHLALREQDDAQRMAHFRAAVQHSPGLRKPWLYLAEYHARRGELQTAWQTIMNGLRHNRSYGEGLEFSKQIWRALRTAPERKQALETLADIFQNEALAWQERLGISADDLAPSDDFAFDDFEFAPNIGLPAIGGDTGALRFRTLTAPPVDPNAPDSALEGVSM